MDDAALYLEVDEDITSAIDKLGKTAGKTVSIVVPKRSSMLQSVINLKLLKKAAAEQGKELVLVTGDKVATDLAARVGLAVAPTLGAEAVLSAAKLAAPAANEDIIEEDDPPPPALVPEATKPEPTASKRPPIFARRELTDKPAEAATVAAGTAMAGEAEAADIGAEGAVPAASAGKGPKVPNFNKLRRRGLWIGGAAAVIVAYFIYMAVFASAKVTIYATANKVEVDTTFAVDPSLHETDKTNAVLAGQSVTFSKDLSGPFTPTGQRDDGTKAHGTVTFKNCEDSNTYPFAGGNTIVSQGLSFTTDAPITIPGGTFSGGGTVCTSPTVSVAVTAAANGDKYNLTNATFTSGKLTGHFIITGSQMSGGTSKISTIVTQADVDKARDALLTTDISGAQKNLDAQAPTGYHNLAASLVQTAGTVTSDPAVDAAGTTATVSFKVTYAEVAVKQAEFNSLIKAAELKQVGPQNQIYDDGLTGALITLTSKTPAGRQSFHLTTEAFGGAKIDTAVVANQIKGKRYGDAQDYLGKLPGVVQSQIALRPGWASNLPGRASKITITIQVAGTK